MLLGIRFLTLARYLGSRCAVVIPLPQRSSRWLRKIMPILFPDFARDFSGLRKLERKVGKKTGSAENTSAIVDDVRQGVQECDAGEAEQGEAPLRRRSAPPQK